MRVLTFFRAEWAIRETLDEMTDEAERRER